MRIESNQLIEDLIEETRKVLNLVSTFEELGAKQLNWKPDSDSWSILECFEHLNRYGRFYIPEITRRITRTKTTSDPYFKSGLLGNYFADSMLPKEKLNKMKTFKSMDPSGSHLTVETIETFKKQQLEILKLLSESRVISLNKTKTSISISNLIKLRLGDTFRVVIYHNMRHMEQCKRVKGLLKEKIPNERSLNKVPISG